MTQRSDEEYVRLCRGGDRKAFDALVERHHRMVYTLALRMVRDPDDAADVTQSVFVKVYEKLGAYDERYKFFSWLYKIALNESLNTLGQKKRFDGLNGLDVADEEQEANDEAVEQEKRVQDGLMMLKVDHRAVIILKHLQGLSYEEIAQVLDLPEKTVKSRLFTARQVLKEILKKKGLG